MERRGSNWIIAVLLVVVGFLAALLIFGNDNNNSSATVSATSATTTANTAPTTTTSAPGTPTTTTTATATATAPNATPVTPPVSVSSCISLWNQANNRGDQTFLVNLAAQQPIRTHVGVSSDVPPKCLITVVGNNGNAWVFAEAGGTTYPFAQAPGVTAGSSLPAAQKIANALDQSDGTLKAR